MSANLPPPVAISRQELHLTPLPGKLGTIFLVGIGGIGLSGIAETLFHMGYHVAGSDIRPGANVLRLQRLGIRIFIGHAAANLDAVGTPVSVVVCSSAIGGGNIERQAARERGIPVISRAEMLSELMRFSPAIAVSGTHGKTTTTSLLATIMEVAELDPTVVNGGVINGWGTNSRKGRGHWFVAEADESDGSFLHLPAQMVVVTSIDPEHMDHFGTFDRVLDAYKHFITRVPFYGCAVCCLDHPEIRKLVGQIDERRIVTYGITTEARVRAENISFTSDRTLFDVVVNGRRRLTGLELPILGRHNVLNALAAIAVCIELDVAPAVIRNALASFSGVQRRFSRIGSLAGRIIFDDYGHHPVEIASVLSAARQAKQDGRLIAVVQPHRYSRLQAMFADFADCLGEADSIILTDVYPAGEEPIPGVNKEALAGELIANGKKDVSTIDDFAQLAGQILDYSQSGDWVICFGAGSISTEAHDMIRHFQADRD